MCCANCGKQVRNGDKFCAECGAAHLPSESSSPTTPPASIYKAWVLFLFALASLWTLVCVVGFVGMLFDNGLGVGDAIGAIGGLGIGLVALYRTAVALGWISGTDGS